MPSDVIAWHDPVRVPASMNAVILRRFGAPEVLAVESVPVPQIVSGEVLVRVAAVAVGRSLDVLARAGRHPWHKFTFPHILGAEHAGTVVATADDVGNVRVGDHVAVFPVVRLPSKEASEPRNPELTRSSELIGTHRQGAYAEYTAIPARNVAPVPSGIDPVQGAAAALAGAVALLQFQRVGGISPGATVLVVGGSSALGSATALLAKHLGATVVVTARGEEKRARLAALGLARVVDPASGQYADLIREAFGGRGADVIVDNLGLSETWDRNLTVLAPGGAIVTSGALGPAQVNVDLRSLHLLSQRIIGVKSATPQSFRDIWDEVNRGYRAPVDRSFPLQDAARAHSYIEQGNNVGRVTLHVP